MMVDTQVRPFDVTSFPIIDAIVESAREDYVPAARREGRLSGGKHQLGRGTCRARAAHIWPKC